MSFSAKGAHKMVIEITSADIISLLNQISDMNVELFSLQYINDISVRLQISNKSFPKIAAISKKTGSSLRCIHISGFSLLKSIISERPVLVSFFIILTLIILITPSRILFVSVEGNVCVPTNTIIEAAENSGIRFWTSRRSVRSEKVKNRLLSSIPELQWVGINTSGCTAVISVKEQTKQNEVGTSRSPVSSIVASQDGVIQSYTVLKGNPLLKVGQAVTKGQVLVSGYLDCGIVTKATQADAEIFALTFREISLISPKPSCIRSDMYKQQVRYSIRIGKNIIKLYKDSGILDTTCGKIYKEECLKLPGGFHLPVSIIKETELCYSLDQSASANARNTIWLEIFADKYINTQMVSGQIIASSKSLTTNEDIICFRGRFTCSEMIAQVKSEVIQKDEPNDRKNCKIRSY